MKPFVAPKSLALDCVYRQSRCRLLKLTICLLVVLVVGVQSQFVQFATAQSSRISSSEPPSESIPLDLNLRIVWGGSEPVDYLATIELDSGVLTGSQQLGIDTNDSSFALKDASNRIAIDDRGTRFGGCDIRVEAKSNAVLKLRLQITDPKTNQIVVKEASWPLKSLRESPDLQEAGLNDCRLSIDRVPGDRLRVITSRSHLVYNAEEPLSIQIQPYALPWTSTVSQFECALFRAGDYSHPIFRKTRALSLDTRGHGEPYDVLANAPKDEGVYELRFKLEPKRLLPGLLVKHTSIERVVQFVVYNTAPANKTAGRHASLNERELLEWQLQSQIPLKSFETQTTTSRLVRQIEGSRRNPFMDVLKSLSPIPNDHFPAPRIDSNESQLSIGPGAIATAWLANLVPGEMHRLSLSTPSASAACRILISSTATRDPKSTESPFANEVFDISNSHSINHVVDPIASAGNETFEVLFWPNSRSAKIEVSNLNGNKVLGVASVIVDVWEKPNAAHDAQSHKPTKPSSVLELHSANVRKVFGADPDSNSETGPPHYDDWRLYLRFAEQVANYCKANGFDSLATTVHAEGGSLFPTYKLNSNARLDTGTFSLDGRDPMRKDIVELMYRAMARHGIQFVPMLEMGSPIREMEEAIEKMDDKEFFQHRGSVAAANPHGHLYNPLSHRVQQSIANALDEFESRYRAHPNYQGYALRVKQPSHLIVSLPIDQTNTTILDRFSSTVVGNLPKDLSQREQFISQRMQAAYSQWTGESIADFLAKLKTQLRWVSVESDPYSTASKRTPAFISPIQLSFQNGDFASVRAAIATQWNLEAPMPIHVAMDRPLNRLESSFVRFANAAKSFQFEKTNSLAYRDNSRTVSKVRVWTSKQNQNAILILNTGAVTETVSLAWPSSPPRFRLFSSQKDESSNETSRIETNATSNEWKLRIAAGESLRIDLPYDSDSPVHWYSQDANILRSLGAALNSLEQGISRLSIPQPRAATLGNPSFEASNNDVRRGRLVGWTTSIDPNATVEIDARQASDGSSSLKIESTSPSSIAWIQSDPFALPQSDRLLVSFQILADPVPPQVTISLSMLDAKSGRFETIASHEVADRIQPTKAQTNWGNVGIDLSNEFQESVQENEAALFRLQMEVKGTGRIWLDDVCICTSFLRERERRDLRSELFLARTSLQNGDSSPAVAMLNSPRGRLIQWGDSYDATSKVMVSLRQDGKEPLAPQVDPRKEPTTTEPKLRPVKRLRNYWWPRKE
jgi:hypothetical protein